MLTSLKFSYFKHIQDSQFFLMQICCSREIVFIFALKLHIVIFYKWDYN